MKVLGPIEERDVLRLAASLDQASGHPTARALVDAALARGLVMTQPTEVAEVPGEGVSGLVGGRLVKVGGPRLMRSHCIPFPETEAVRNANAVAATVLVAVDGKPAAVLRFADPLRTDGGRTLADLRRCGIQRVVLATGDRRGVAQSLIEGLPIDALEADLDPAGKTQVVANERGHGLVMMVGDGVNDAPALAAADLGVALGARGAAAAAEAADVVLLIDSLAPLPQAIRIAKRARVIALQSVMVGLGLSLAGMVAAAPRLPVAAAGRPYAGSYRRGRHPQRHAGTRRSHDRHGIGYRNSRAAGPCTSDGPLRWINAGGTGRSH